MFGSQRGARGSIQWRSFLSKRDLKRDSVWLEPSSIVCLRKGDWSREPIPIGIALPFRLLPPRRTRGGCQPLYVEVTADHHHPLLRPARNSLSHSALARRRVAELIRQRKWPINLEPMDEDCNLFEGFCLFSCGSSLNPRHIDQTGVMTKISCLASHQLWIVHAKRGANYVLLEQGSRM